ncbi:MAG: ARMT1-like domain-containing protein [Thermoplasmata archaeon]
MKIRAGCVPCLLGRTLYETDLIDSSMALRVMEEASKIIGSYDLKDACSADVATKVHRATYSILGNRDPYKVIKNRCNQTVLSLFPKAEKMIEGSEDRLKCAVLCSIIGNVLDFGLPSSPESPEKLMEQFDNLVSEGLDSDDTEKIKAYLEKGGKVLYFADNCGEIVLDKLLCKEIKKFDVHLSLVVRGEPILTDATIEDVKEFGLDEVVDEVLTTGCFAVGVDFENLPEELSKALQGANLIISKGMANYETFSETNYKPIAHLLRTKCEPVAEDMGLRTDINVVKVYE